MKEATPEQVNARRNQILDAAAKVFAEKGFHPTTIKDIAREARIADGTVYIYFENKTALLLGVFDRMRASVQPDDAVLDISGMDFRSFLKTSFQYALMTPRENNFALFRIVISEMMVNPELRDLYFQRILEPALVGGEQLMSQWAELHAVKPVDMALASRAISSIVLGLIIEHIMGDSTLNAKWEALPDFLADLFLDGIGADQP